MKITTNGKALLLTLLLCLVISGFAQKTKICQEDWTEDEGNHIMKKWIREWNTQADWEKREEIIRKLVYDFKI